MSRDASITLHFGDGEHLFRLRIGQMFELQDKINRPRLQMMAAVGVENPMPIGPGRIVKELGAGDLWPQEVREILRIGLVGGGMRPSAADVLLHRHFGAYEHGESSYMALQVLKAALEGDDTAPKAQTTAGAAAADTDASIQPTTGSIPPRSTETPPSSISTHEPSTNSHSTNSLQ